MRPKAGDRLQPASRCPAPPSDAEILPRGHRERTTISRGTAGRQAYTAPGQPPESDALMGRRRTNLPLKTFALRNRALTGCHSTPLGTTWSQAACRRTPSTRGECTGCRGGACNSWTVAVGDALLPGTCPLRLPLHTIHSYTSSAAVPRWDARGGTSSAQPTPSFGWWTASP